MANGKHLIERLDLQFDGRPWGIGYGVSNDTQGAVTEYVLPGETVHAWTELVTVELLPPHHSAGIDALMEMTRALLAQMCLQFTWRVLNRENQDVLYEWRHAGSPEMGQPPQHEIARYVKGERGIHRAAYVAKTNPLPAQVRDQWVKLIGQGKLVKHASAPWAK
jgi:hypothetical protein